MAGLSGEIDNNEKYLDKNIVQRYYGSLSLGGVDLLVFYKLFKTEDNNTPPLFNNNKNNFIETIDYIIETFSSFKKAPIWMVNIRIDFNLFETCWCLNKKNETIFLNTFTGQIND